MFKKSTVCLDEEYPAIQKRAKQKMSKFNGPMKQESETTVKTDVLTIQKTKHQPR